MDNSKALQDALNAIDPARLNYQEWTEVGMALKAEGLPVSVWDDWSRRDLGRYHFGECEKKWNTFGSSGVSGGTIFHLAKESGYVSNRALDWDDGLEAYYDEVIAQAAKPEEEPYQMAIRYLETLFLPGENVSFVHAALYKEDRDKWVPADSGHVIGRDKLIKDLKK